MSLGVLDAETFCRCCRLLLQLNDGWTWQSVQGSQDGFLRKTLLRPAVLNPNPVRDQEEAGPATHTSGPSCYTHSAASSSQPLVDEDDVGVVPGGSCTVLHFDYHVLYSSSYSTPVLYFRASTLEGRSVSLEEVWSSVHPSFRTRLVHSPLSTISQQEHPLLGQPFFMLHPCRTHEFMRPVLQSAQDQHRPVNYMLTWLSVVGPLVGLEVPLQYSTQLQSLSACV